MGDILRDEDFEDLELLLDFFPDADPARPVSLSPDVDLDVDDDLRFFASGLDFDDDSFCFLIVGGLCTLVASTLLFLRFLLVAVVVGPGRCPVTGSRFSLAADTSRVLFDGDGDDNREVSVISIALGFGISGRGLSKKTVKLRAAINAINQEKRVEGDNAGNEAMVGVL
jgi:hypothetical protein